MKKLDVMLNPKRFGNEKEVWCDDKKIGEINSHFKGTPVLCYSRSGSSVNFKTQTLAVIDLGKAVFGDDEEFVVSPDWDKE